MSEPLDITDEERFYFAKGNESLSAMKIASLKSWVTWVRANREVIDRTIHELRGDGPFRRDYNVDSVDGETGRSE
jgi:hypothetical protein